MKKLLQLFLIPLLVICVAIPASNAQKSVLINFGSPNCVDGNNPYFSFIKNPLGNNPAIMANCSMSSQVGNFFGVFVAYNPKDNKVYVASVQTLSDTKIWVLDIGLPGSVNCPANIPIAPNYAYNYVSNNFEFDNNGDLWSLSNYDPVEGVCNIDKFDVNNGNVINTRVVKFPDTKFPESITSGDIAITPNGRMFATLGQNPSILYEIKGYSGTDTANAVYLQTMPFNCYGIAYLDGQLEITGTNLVNTCYYYDYNIGSNTLGQVKLFQNGLGPIDNTSFTPELGTTKQLISATKINSNTADLVYEVYVRNMGNVILRNINVTEDLQATFGAGNVSNVSANFVNGFNAGGLTINPAYNGTTVTQVLNNNQVLPNNTSKNQDYYFKLLINCRVTNLVNNVTYLNSAIGTAFINNQVDIINVSDSSNNGPQDVIDPNNDGNPGGPGENIPTPFNLSLLPVHFLNISGNLVNKTSANILWTVATPTANAARFDIEFSADANSWQQLGTVAITDPRQGKYQFAHMNIPAGNLYYRIKQTDKDGQFIYSSIVLLQNNKSANSFTVYPNPARSTISISAPYNSNGKSSVELFDATGRKMLQVEVNSNASVINVEHLVNGYYLLKITHNNQVQTQKILVSH